LKISAGLPPKGEWFAVIPAFAAALALASSAAAEPAKTDISGFWVLKSDPLAAPPAQLTPAGAKELKRIKSGSGLNVAKGSPAYALTWCTVWGMPWQMTSKQPLDIRQGPLETAVMPGIRAETHHIYTDGQPHPDMDVFDPLTVGHSIGRLQGGALVADTVGFSDEGVLLIPGDGVRSPTSHLVERYRLTGPDALSITFTWTDKVMLRKPHTYTYRYTRASAPTWMPEQQCNPLKAMRAKGLPLPPDAPPE
jgi:hypothetical protein